MSENTPEVNARGIGLCGAMFLLFLGLQLTVHINWAWYWVAAPMLIPLGVVELVVSVLGAVALVVWLAERVRKRKPDSKTQRGRR